jgi:hypothetical protein
MDSFTIAVVVGGAVVLAVFLGLFLMDRGEPETSGKQPPRKKP